MRPFWSRFALTTVGIYSAKLLIFIGLNGGFAPHENDVFFLMNQFVASVSGAP